MVQILLVRPGASDYDVACRVQGRLDIPMNAQGVDEVHALVADIGDCNITAIYSSPCTAAFETAEAIGASHGVKPKRIPDLKNLDLGLWEGKLVGEIRAAQPKVYKRWQESPETVCPPEGEMLNEARRRLELVLEKKLRKQRQGTVAFVLPEPLATIFSGLVRGQEIGDLWQTAQMSGKWELIEYAPQVAIRE